MAENPYQPPADPESLSPADLAAAALRPPRYQGPPGIIEGRLDETRAIEFASQCEASGTHRVETDSSKSSLNKNAFTLLLIAATLLTTIIVPTIANSVQPASAPTEITRALTTFFLSAVLPIVLVFGVVLFLFRRYGMNPAELDPPLGGETRFLIQRDGCSIAKHTRDGRPIEIYCPWEQVKLSEGPDAWLLSSGVYDRFLIAKSWIDDRSTEHWLRTLRKDLAAWQLQQQPAYADVQAKSLRDVSDSFPDYRINSVCLSLKASAESQARKRVEAKLSDQLPELHRQKRKLPGAAFWIGFGVFSAFVFFGTQLLVSNHFRLSEMEVAAMVLPIVLFAGLLIWFYRMSQWDPTVEAAINREDVWFNYKTSLVRLPLEGFSFRTVVDDSLVLATETGSSLLVLPKIAFRSEDDFAETVRGIVRSDSQRRQIVPPQSVPSTV
jgi:hypothetical protein